MGVAPLRRPVCFAGAAVSLEVHGQPLTQLVDFLFAETAADCSIPPCKQYRLRPAPASPDTFTLHCDEALIYDGPTLTELADRLLGSVCHFLADQSRGGLLFHAAAVAWGQRGFILPGTMGAGKTTLTAWLLTQQFSYLSDELVYVSAGSDQIEAFPRPLNLKRPSRPVLADYLDFSAPSPGILTSQFTDLVWPTLLNPTTRFSQPPLSGIIFPNYQADAPFKLEPLSKAQAGKALLECLINARNLPGHGFDEAVRLARQTPAYRLTYSRFSQLDLLIERLLSFDR